MRNNPNRIINVEDYEIAALDMAEIQDEICLIEESIEDEEE